MIKKSIYLILVVLIAFLFSGCNLTKNLFKNDREIVVTEEGKTISKYSTVESSESTGDAGSKKTDTTIENKTSVYATYKTSPSVEVAEKPVKSDGEILQPNFKKINNVDLFNNSHNRVKESDYYQYSFLNGDYKILYERINSAVKESLSIVEVSDLELDEKMVPKIFTLYLTDFPQYFYLSKTYYQVYDSSGNSVRALVLLYTDGIVTDNYDGKLKPSVTANRDVINSQIFAFQCFMEDSLTKIPNGESDIIKERIIHDLVAEWVSYDDKIAESDFDYTVSVPMDFNVYGAAVERSAVCEGYSKLFQYMCLSVGINCTVVQGDPNSFLHMWNAVLIDGDWYHTDVTWNDEEEFISYLYFNVTSRTIRTDHKIDYSTLKVPECNSNEKSFLNYFAVYVSSLHKKPLRFEEQILIANKLPNKKIYVYFSNYIRDDSGNVNADYYKSYMADFVYNNESDFMKFANANNISVSNRYTVEYNFLVIQNN